mgnify:FL=1
MSRLNEDIIIGVIDEADKLDIKAGEQFIRDVFIGRKAVYIHTELVDGEAFSSLKHGVIKDVQQDYYNFVIHFLKSRSAKLTDLIYIDINHKDFLRGVDDILAIVSDSNYRSFDEFIYQNEVSLDIMHRVFDHIVAFGESRGARS